MSRAFKSLAIFAAFIIIFALSRHMISPTTTTTTSTSTTSTSSTTTTTTATPVGTTCTGSSFTGVYNEGEGAAGTIFASVTLTKTTSGSCTVNGFPLLTLQDKTGAILNAKILDKSPVQFPSAQANQPAGDVTLHAGSTLNFSLGYSDVQVGNEVCGTATTISVQFKTGGTSVPVTPAYPVEPCNANTVWVSPFY